MGRLFAFVYLEPVNLLWWWWEDTNTNRARRARQCLEHVMPSNHDNISNYTLPSKGSPQSSRSRIMCAFLTSCSMKRRILGIEAVREGRLRLDAEIEVIQSCALCQHPCKTLPRLLQSHCQWNRSCRGREASSFVAWSSLWTSFIGALHCFLFVICLADRQQERVTYCTNTTW